MNYSCKIQSAGLHGPLSISKSFNRENIVREHFFGKYLYSTNNGRNFLAYTLTLKFLKKMLKLNNNVSKKFTNSKLQGANQLLKVDESKNSQTEIKIHQMKPSKVELAKEPERTNESFLSYNKYICSSTKSFDPNLLIHNEFQMRIIHNNIKYEKEENSLIELGLQNKNKLINFDFLKSFPLNSEIVLFLSRESIKEKSVVHTKKVIKGNKYKQKTISQATNLELQKQNEYIKEEFKDSNESEFKKLFTLLDINFLQEEKKFFKFMLSYVDVTVNSNNLEEALNMLSESRKKTIWKSKFIKKNAAEFCNLIMNRYGLLGDWTTVCKIKNWMIEDQINFNCQSYAALLDCLERTNDDLDKHQEVIKILQELKKKKKLLNGLFTKTILSFDQRQNILRAIQRVYPDFEITYSEINLKSNCSLLSNLYTKNSKLMPQFDESSSDKSLKDLVDMQVELEKNFSVTIDPIPTKKTTFDKFDKQLKYLENIKEEWRVMLKEGFIQNQNLNKYSNLKFFLNCLSPDVYVDLMMEEIDILSKFSSYFTQSTSICYKNLGEKIEKRYETQKKVQEKALDNFVKLFYKYCEWYANPNGAALNSRQQWQMILQKNVNYHPPDVIHFKWPSKINKDLGKFLYEIIFKKIKINVGTTLNPRLVPACYRIVRFNSVSEEQIKFHPKLNKIFKELGFYKLTFDTSQYPMLCPPRPWTSVVDGGYLSHSTRFYRKTTQQYFKSIDVKKIPSVKLYAAFDSLNAIQNTPWKINEPVLDIVLEIFKNGGDEKLDVAKYPEKVSIKPWVSTLNAEETIQQRKLYAKLVQEQKDRYSLWCEALYRLSLANHLRKKTFWLPYNFDFRGRLYPVPPLINHLGSDTYRALLLFAKGRPLGPNGLDWIKIHTISLTGSHKSKSLEERLAYANNILPDIINSAKYPLLGDGWWQKSDAPWQTLAACMEIKKALDSPNPENYITNLPIHQDGSCNGLQHYAALGKDREGGVSVNLTYCSHPQDVYSTVASLIEKRRIADAEEGVSIAKILEGFVRRKVIKQTVMTTIYGVTLYGAKLQIAKQLKTFENFPQEHVMEASIYLTRLTFECLEQMFSSAKFIKSWFTQCADVIVGKQKHVKWISPIGLPIMQPYSSENKTHITKDGHTHSNWKPNKRKQKSAFPPNFIHSLDSSHLMLTALFCEQAGLTFASIHDCYWTHPITVDIMNKICREQFLSLHSQPILENLSKMFIHSFEKNISKNDLAVFQNLPSTGDLDLKEVLNSIYFFS